MRSTQVAKLNIQHKVFKPTLKTFFMLQKRTLEWNL